MVKQHIISICFLFWMPAVIAQHYILDVGLRLQHSVNLYNENGFSVAYSPGHFKHDRLYLGFSFVTSRLGSAFHSNAIKQDNVLVSAAWMLRRNHFIRPFGRLNAGFFSASYGNKLFDDLPSKSLLFSPDLGLCFETNLPLKISTSFGYNLITGNGTAGPGTLYPAYYQLTFSWSICQKKQSPGQHEKPARKKW